MSARRTPRPAVHARAALATGAIMAGTVVAHGWAGGAVPSSPWLAGVTALVFAATVAVFRGVVSGPVMFLALGSAQFALHGVLILLATPMAHETGTQVGGTHGMSPGSLVADLFAMDGRMVLAHAISALLTATMWSVTARAIESLVRLPEDPRRGVPGPMRATEHVTTPRTPPAPWLSGAPRRGPPCEVLPLYA